MNLIKQLLNIIWWRAGGDKPLFGPLRVQWDINYACNSRCLHCSRWRPEFKKALKEEPELNTTQGKKLIRQLADSGTLHLGFVGNEPLLRKDIFELISFSRKLGITTMLATNGLALTPKVAQKIIASGLDILYFSLDGSRPEIHDHVRGVNGALKKTLSAIRLCRKLRRQNRPRLMATIVASKNNLGDLSNIVSLAKKVGLDGAIIQPLIFYPVGGEAAKSLAFSKKDIDRLEKELLQVKKEFGNFIPVMKEYYEKVATYYRQPEKLYRYPCSAGFLSLDIHQNGDFSPCPIWGEKMGNFIKEGSVKKVWFSAKAQAVRQKVKQNQHPICWAGCLWPMNLYLHYLHPLRFGKLINRSLLNYAALKIRNENRACLSSLSKR